MTDTDDSNDNARAPTKRRRSLSAHHAAERAERYVERFTTRRPQSVTSLQRDGNVWRIGVEVIEVERIPSSTDVLAVYEVEIDDDGELVGFRRTSRFLRGQTED